VPARLYLPEAWATNQARRGKVHVPPEGVFQTKPALALALVDQARAGGVPFAWVVADAGYSDNPAFVQGLDDRQVAYMVGVSSTLGVRLPEEVQGQRWERPRTPGAAASPRSRALRRFIRPRPSW
jgi:SRSO17 transposase